MFTKRPFANVVTKTLCREYCLRIPAVFGKLTSPLATGTGQSTLLMCLALRSGTLKLGLVATEAQTRPPKSRKPMTCLALSMDHLNIGNPSFMAPTRNSTAFHAHGTMDLRTLEICFLPSTLPRPSRRSRQSSITTTIVRS